MQLCSGNLGLTQCQKDIKKQFLELLVSVKVNIQYLLRIETYHWLCYKQMGVSCAEC